jgi:integrase
MIEDYKLKRLESVAPATLNGEMNTIKNMFRKAVKWEYLRESPAKPVKWIKTSKSSMRFLAREEADIFLEASKQSRNPHFHSIIVVALHTRIRRGEILRQQWRDVDFKSGRMNVVGREGSHTKNYDSRPIPMSLTVIDFLKRHPRRPHSPYVFRNAKGEPFRDVDTSFADAFKKSGVSPFRFHDLRHTFAGWLVMGSVDIRTVQELLGQKDLRMTMRYVHLALDHMMRAVRVLDRRAEETRMKLTKILDGHYLDTEGPDKEKQDAGLQA